MKLRERRGKGIAERSGGREDCVWDIVCDRNLFSIKKKEIFLCIEVLLRKLFLVLTTRLKYLREQI